MNERISALMDGEVDEPELARDLAQLRSNGDLRRSWDTYHLIGDTLRGHVAPALAARASAVGRRRATRRASCGACGCGHAGGGGRGELSPRPSELLAGGCH